MPTPKPPYHQTRRKTGKVRADILRPRCDASVHFSLRVVGAGETLHSWRQCKRLAAVTLISWSALDPAWDRVPMCRQHFARLVRP